MELDYNLPLDYVLYMAASERGNLVCDGDSLTMEWEEYTFPCEDNH